MDRPWLWRSLLFLVAAGCGGGESEQGAREDSTAEQTMHDMPGMNMGGSQAQGMMREMRDHMRTMTGAHGDSLTRLLPMHRQMTANMLQQMDSEMRQMGMAADSGWAALVDSIRQDLAHLPDVGKAELPSFMTRHRERVERLMEQQHGAMMSH